MKNMPLIFLFNKRAGSIVAVFIVLLFVLGCLCTGRNQSTPLPAEYIGEWNGSDGSFLRIRPDGTADFVQGGTKIENSSVEIEGNKLRLKLLVTLKEFTIEQPPVGGRMKLSGITYNNFGETEDSLSTRKDGFDVPPKMEREQDKPVKSTNTTMVEDLVRNTLLDFNEAVQLEDFSLMHAKASKPFRKQFTPQSMKVAFSAFMVQKRALDPIFQQVNELKPVFSIGPKYSKKQGYDILIVEGYYPTTPSRINFANGYLLEDGTWKLAKIDINVR